jgi:hypothetical protein
MGNSMCNIDHPIPRMTNRESSPTAIRIYNGRIRNEQDAAGRE